MSEMVERVARAIADHEVNFLDYMDRARAAIEAMREPTSPMLDRFVSRALCVSVHGDGGWSNYAREQWQAMIDAALSTSQRENGQ